MCSVGDSFLFAACDCTSLNFVDLEEYLNLFAVGHLSSINASYWLNLSQLLLQTDDHEFENPAGWETHCTFAADAAEQMYFGDVSLAAVLDALGQCDFAAAAAAAAEQMYFGGVSFAAVLDALEQCDFAAAAAAAEQMSFGTGSQAAVLAVLGYYVFAAAVAAAAEVISFATGLLTAVLAALEIKISNLNMAETKNLLAAYIDVYF